LRRTAVTAGLAPERLVFAPMIAPDRHLARMRKADLFLDLLPCGAHTTASDALWAGLPVLTCVGEAFAARVAASLLTATGLPELIVPTLDEYEELAVHLATHPEQLAGIRRRLGESRLSAPLFDTPRYARHIEAAFAKIYARQQSGLSPDHIVVKSESA
jgi:predicted O-linked N-acetylglucosamine transferase (SPINDLY family)